MKNTPYFLALNRIPGIGPRIVSRCLDYFPNLSELFRQPMMTLINIGLSANHASAISRFDFQQIESELRWQEQPQQVILTWEHPDYPPILKAISSPPLVLFAKGYLPCLNMPCLAMVGSRSPTVLGIENARTFAEHLASVGFCIVSGLALGIDGAAHEGCLRSSGRTVAVLGTGIDQIYPYSHQKLATKIIEKGLLLSEFPLKTLPKAGHFPRRNRIISGLSCATLVVEAAIRSGSLITARLALEQNRDVLAIPGSIDNPQASGCHKLLQDGAKLVTSCQDVVDELNLGHYFVDEGLSNRNIACENNQLMQCIGYAVTSVEQVMSRSGLTIQELLCKLADLELQGLIKAVSGGYVRYNDER